MATTRTTVTSFTTGQESAAPPPVPYAFLFIIVGMIVPALIAYGFGTLNETQVIAVILAILGLCGILARPFVGLIFFTCLLYTRPEESIPALAGMHFTLIVALVTLIGMLVQFALHRVPLVRTPFIGMMIGFAVAGMVSGAVAGTFSDATMDFARLVVLILLILNLMRTPDRYAAFVTALIIFTCYLALYSIYLFQSGIAVIDNGMVEGLARSTGTGIFSDPNDLAATFVAGLALTLTRVLQNRKYKRIFYSGLVLTLLWAIVLTNSRGGMLALIVVVGSFCLVFSRRKALAIALAVVIVGIALVAAPGRMTNFDNKEESANSRFGFWQEGLTQLELHPLSGVGYNKFPDVNGGFVAHNSFVNCFAELGFPAFYFWMGGIYLAFRRRTASQGDPDGEFLPSQDLTGARLALLGYLSAGFWITRTYAPNLYILLSLPLAQQIATSGQHLLPIYNEEEKGKVRGRILLLCLGMLVLIRIMVQGK